MKAAKGILTARGGLTSHAAVVARGMGRPCVAGAGGISVDYNQQTLIAAGHTVRAGDTVTLDGATGEVFIGSVAMIEPALSGDFGTLMEWADGVRRLKVRANAETPLDCQTARDFGAEGVGLYRTEFLYLGKQSDPTESEHFEAYRTVLDTLGPDRPVVMSSTMVEWLTAEDGT